MENNFKVYEEEVFDLLTNPQKINRVSFYEKSFRLNTENFLSEAMKCESNLELAEVCSYLFGKVFEIIILKIIRPEFTKIWITKQEAKGGLISTNLPKHLHEQVLEAMDGCETALERFLEGFSGDIKELLTDIQLIGESLCNKHKVYDVQIENYSNKDILVPSEVFEIANNAVLPGFEQEGYEVEGYTNNFNSLVSFILNKEDKKYFILERTIHNETDLKVPAFLRDGLKNVALKGEGHARILGVYVYSVDEKEKELGIITKKSKISIRRSELIIA